MVKLDPNAKTSLENPSFEWDDDPWPPGDKILLMYCGGGEENVARVFAKAEHANFEDMKNALLQIRDEWVAAIEGGTDTERVQVGGNTGWLTMRPRNFRTWPDDFQK